MGNRLLFRDFFLIQDYWILLFKDSLSSQPTKKLKKHLEHNEQTNQNHQEDKQHKNRKHSSSTIMTKYLVHLYILTCVQKVILPLIHFLMRGVG